MRAWWTGIPAAEATVPCGGHTHTLRWEHGALTAMDHGDPEAEATLAALAGEPAPCLDHLSAWNRRRDDPRVLTLASRGVLDALDVQINQHPHPRAPTPRRSETELLELLALGGGLPDRLQAHAAASWTRRLRTGHSALPAALPQLNAALYGRALSALRLWLGEPNLAIDLTMIDPTSDAHLADQCLGPRPGHDLRSPLPPSRYRRWHQLDSRHPRDRPPRDGTTLDLATETPVNGQTLSAAVRAPARRCIQRAGAGVDTGPNEGVLSGVRPAGRPLPDRTPRLPLSLLRPPELGPPPCPGSDILVARRPPASRGPTSPSGSIQVPPRASAGARP
jgi:hypothetical protein